jgi:hypothetical protein
MSWCLAASLGTVPRASAPLTIFLAGRRWRYGPARVDVTLTERGAEHSRCLLRWDDLRLLVDPSLPAPAEDEGPLSAEAGLLRELNPTTPVEVVLIGPRPPQPGAREAAGAAIRRALEAPVDAIDPAHPELEAFLDSSFLLVRDRITAATPCADPLAGLSDDTAAWAESARGTGLDAPRTPREEDVFASLRAAGLAARWPLADGVAILLAEPGKRDALGAALGDHGLERLPLSFGGADE